MIRRKALVKQTENIGFDYECIIATDNVDKINFYQGYYKLIFVIDGELTVNINGETVVLEKQGYMVIRPTDNAFVKEAKSTKALLIDVAQSEILQLLNFLGEECTEYIVSHKSLFVNGDYNVKSKVDEIYNRILKYGDKEHLLAKLIVIELLSGMVRVMHRKNHDDVIPQHIVNAVNSMKELKNLRQGVQYLEQTLNYSRSQLCRIFNKYYATPPSTFVWGVRLSYAYNMIVYTDYDIDEIAESVGFVSLSHFYEKFKLEYKTTPSKLRKSIKKDSAI